MFLASELVDKILRCYHSEKIQPLQLEVLSLFSFVRSCSVTIQNTMKPLQHYLHLVRFLTSWNTVNPLLSPPPRGSFISNPFEWGLIGTGGLFNLEKTMVSVFHRELEDKVESSSRTSWRSAMHSRIKNKSDLPDGEKTIPDQSTRSFIVVIDYKWRIIRGGERGS